MKQTILTIMISTIAITAKADTVINMVHYNWVYHMPCSVNGVNMLFVYDTGASDVTISLTEALFMLKNGYLQTEDILGEESYQIANGDIEEGTIINIKEINIGGLIIKNVKGSIIHEMKAPLLLGQSVLEKLGKIEFDYNHNTLTIKEDFYMTDSSGLEREKSHEIVTNDSDAFSELKNAINSTINKVKHQKQEPRRRIAIPYYNLTSRKE